VRDILRNELYIGQYAVADVEEMIEDYAIVDELTFEEAQSLRYRFLSDGHSQTGMCENRQSNTAEAVLSEFRAYIDNLSTEVTTD
jgi:site-specific DNA recombinase